MSRLHRQIPVSCYHYPENGAEYLYRVKNGTYAGWPQHLLAYKPDATIFELAAAHGYGLARNHCFPDANERTALIAMGSFLKSNGIELKPDEDESLTAMLVPAACDMSEAELAVWLDKNRLSE